MGGHGLVKRSVSIAGHRTSVSLEEPFWHALVALAGRRRLSLAALVAVIDRERGTGNLSSAIRVAVLGDALARAAADEPRPPSPAGGGSACGRSPEDGVG